MAPLILHYQKLLQHRHGPYHPVLPEACHSNTGMAPAILYYQEQLRRDATTHRDIGIPSVGIDPTTTYPTAQVIPLGHRGIYTAVDGYDEGLIAVDASVVYCFLG